MRLEPLFLAFSLSSGCPTLSDHENPTEVDQDSADSIEDVKVQQVPELAPNPWNEELDGEEDDIEEDDIEEDDIENDDTPPAEGIQVFQEYETTDTSTGNVCDLTLKTVGEEYEDNCDDCVFAFTVDTKLMNPRAAEGCWPGSYDSMWLLREHEESDNDYVWGVDNIRIQFHQTLETPDGVLTNVLVTVADVYEFVENIGEVDYWEETTILAHDGSEVGRAGVSKGRVWWTLDDGVSRVMASGIYAP